MASTTLLRNFSLFLFLMLLLVSPSSSSSTILDAAEILSGSGFESMALSLKLASQTVWPSRSRTLTIFAPTDFAFKHFPYLPPNLLRYHLLPHAFSLHSLTSLPFGANIPTLAPSRSLTVTITASDSRRVSINNVTVNATPIFDDGSLVIFGIENFFNPYFQIETIAKSKSNGNATALSSPHAAGSAACFRARKNEMFSFREASGVLRSRGYSVMASFLDIMLLGLQIRDQCPRLTLFAPIDEVLPSRASHLSDYPSILRKHLVPRKISWSDLVSLEEGTLISTYEGDFTLNVTKTSNDMLLLNGVAVILPELYHSDWLVVHGLQDLLSGAKDSGLVRWNKKMLKNLIGLDLLLHNTISTFLLFI